MTSKERAETYRDNLLTMPTSQENIAAGLEVDAYQTGISAYIWGYPLVRMERVAREYTDVPHPKPPTSYRAPLNQIGWATALATPEAKDMPTANNDTLYMSAVVSLVNHTSSMSPTPRTATMCSICGRNWNITSAAVPLAPGPVTLPWWACRSCWSQPICWEGERMTRSLQDELT